jgi:hypothetical protein
MTRGYTTQDLVALPRLNAREADVLATQLLSAAKATEDAGSPLPPELSRPLGRLRPASVKLGEVLEPREGDTPVKKKADKLIDTCWKATQKWLDGWRILPGEDNLINRNKAESLFNICFSDGLAFTKFRYPIEWRESGGKLSAIERAGHRQTFTDLGGAVFLSTLEKAQAHYGEVLGITTPPPDVDPDAAIRPQLDALLEAMRDYVGKVGAYPDPELPGSQELSNRLLRPIVEWDPLKASTSGAATASPRAPEPAPEPAPGSGGTEEPPPGI